MIAVIAACLARSPVVLAPMEDVTDAGVSPGSVARSAPRCA